MIAKEFDEIRRILSGRYKLCEDMLKLFMEKGTDLDIDRIIELAYVMHLQAEGYTTEQFNAETEDDYIAWLEQFDFTELLQHAPEILGIWVDTSKQQSKSKKKSS